VKSSPAYLGESLEFLLSPDLVEGFHDLAGCVRRGGTTVSARGTMETQHPVWVKFARVMGPVIARSAPFIAELADPKADRPLEVLDIAAGHGQFGIAFAQRNPRVRVTAQDWAPVLEVAREHARQAAVADRHRLLPGDAFEVDLGTGYDVVLLTNFLHHFDVPTCERLLGRVARSLKPGGIAVTLEFVPNEDRITPPATAAFAFTMLATTAAGDAYTFNEYHSMFRDTGFLRSTLHPVPDSPQSVIISVL
jgi:SAM-dependent methyltransferase